ncbi:hypothetical protein PR202_ga17193 [Eleusine coracana subsp. coracana]|uniref:PH domain-containing protein n=1 Tax=Eleusine coracana subsp. coracana TaxID=191504 RepID=A0AAV5CNC4_ELECO|nr:hypothetical protein PR202_ga17193 [Eleusine coracana subsp. coracana]
MFGFFGRNTEATPKPTFRVFSKADERRCLAVRDGTLVLAAADPGDERQHWTKDVRYSRVVKDEEDHPVFSLVNAPTGLAVQRSLGPGHPVGTLFPFDLDCWFACWLGSTRTTTTDLRKAFGCIRIMHNVDLTMDAPLISDGGAVVLSYIKGGNRSDGQSWKTLPWNGETSDLDGLHSMPTSRIYCKADEGFSVTIRDGAICLGRTNPGDKYQHWIVDKRPGDTIRDMDAYPAFALVNKVSGEAISEQSCTLKLKSYNPNFLDVSVLWTTSPDFGHGFRCIHGVDNISRNFDAYYREAKKDKPVISQRIRNLVLQGYRVQDMEDEDDHGGKVRDGARIGLSHWCEGDNLQWKIIPWCKSPCDAHLTSYFPVAAAFP